jgi:tRNA-Thr(GGU) m(6)t(6)A37 methyltransferase TsaA
MQRVSLNNSYLNRDTMQLNESIFFRPIGTIETPFDDPAGMPIQPTGAAEVIGRVVVDAALTEALDDLEGFSHLILIYHFHRSSGFALKVKPFMDTEVRGLFATRAPRRPNPVGLSVVRLLSRSTNILEVQGIDVLNGTPLLDIKPFVPDFDAPPAERTGWLAATSEKARSLRADDRFKTED